MIKMKPLLTKNSFNIIFYIMAIYAINVSSFSIIAQPAHENCDDLVCVRKNIDSINEQLVELLAARMEYVHQAGRIKLKNNNNSALDKKRADTVIAQAENLNASIKRH